MKLSTALSNIRMHLTATPGVAHFRRQVMWGNLPATLKTIKDAVLAGELDTEIGLIAKERVPKKKLKAA